MRFDPSITSVCEVFRKAVCRRRTFLGLKSDSMHIPSSCSELIYVHLRIRSRNNSQHTAAIESHLKQLAGYYPITMQLVQVSRLNLLRFILLEFFEKTMIHTIIVFIHKYYNLNIKKQNMLLIYMYTYYNII